MNKISVDTLRSFLTYSPVTGLLTWLPRPNCARNDRAGKTAGHIRKDGYVHISINRKPFLGHRVAWAIHHGEWPDKHLDHINRRRADNRIENLRLATRSQNLQNTPRYANNRSGCKGVYLHGWGKYEAFITVDKKRIYLGVFNTLEEARAMRMKAQEKFFVAGGSV